MVEGRDRGANFSQVSDEDFVSIGDLFQALWRRVWIILLVMVVCTGAALVISLLKTPLYEASVKLLVGQQQAVIAEDPFVAPRLNEMAVTLAEAVPARPVAEPVVERLDLDISPEGLVGGLEAYAIPDTQFIVVTYTDTDPERTQQVVNAIAEEFSKRVSEMSPDNISGVTVTIWERASAPHAPVSPDHERSGLMGLVLGGMLGVGLAFVLEYRDDSWESPEEVEQVSRVPTYGVIPTFRVLDEGKGIRANGSLWVGTPRPERKDR